MARPTGLPPSAESLTSTTGFAGPSSRAGAAHGHRMAKSLLFSRRSCSLRLFSSSRGSTSRCWRGSVLRRLSEESSRSNFDAASTRSALRGEPATLPCNGRLRRRRGVTADFRAKVLRASLREGTTTAGGLRRGGETTPVKKDWRLWIAGRTTGFLNAYFTMIKARTNDSIFKVPGYARLVATDHAGTRC